MRVLVLSLSVAALVAVGCVGPLKGCTLHIVERFELSCPMPERAPRAPEPVVEREPVAAPVPVPVAVGDE